MNYSGLAKIIPFKPRPQVVVGPPWSTAELGELFRVAHILRQSGMAIETDMGLSDEGDPWFVFFSAQSEDVIAHFARINGEIIVHGLSIGAAIAGVDLQDVVKRLKPVQALEQQQQAQGSRSVVLHPFMLLVAFVAASFLATEESQAAATLDKVSGKPDVHPETLSKAKSDWFDRAMSLLTNKASKDRLDSAVQELATGRAKLDSSDAMHHSLGLVMLAAAISQAQADVLFSVTPLGAESDVPLKPITENYKAVGDGAIAVANAVVVDPLAATPVSPTVTRLAHSDSPLAVDVGTLASGLVDISALSAGGDNLPSALLAPMPVSAPMSMSSDVTPLVATILSPQEQVLLPEVVPVAPAAVKASPTAAPVKAAPVTAAPVMTSIGTSLDLTFEGGLLQFHQSLVDIRYIDVVASLPEPVPGPDSKGPGGIVTTPLPVIPSPHVRTIVLTDAEENILIDSGDIRIKNFDFGVDHLVISDPTLLKKPPEVFFSYSGDVVIYFNETTRVVLVGVFAPSEMFAGVASISTPVV